MLLPSLVLLIMRLLLCCCGGAPENVAEFDSIDTSPGPKLNLSELQQVQSSKQNESDTAPSDGSNTQGKKGALLTPRLFKDLPGPIEREMRRRSSSKAADMASALRRPSQEHLEAAPAELNTVEDEEHMQADEAAPSTAEPPWQ